MEFNVKIQCEINVSISWNTLKVIYNSVSFPLGYAFLVSERLLSKQKDSQFINYQKWKHKRDNDSIM